MKARDGNFTAEELRRVLSYDPDTGIFRWLALPHSSASNIEIGDIAGYKENTGYIRIAVFGRRYQAHRLAWLHFYGKWPDERIDHRDLDNANNAISNLRLASDSQNSSNRRCHSNNLLSKKGVQLHTQSGKYRARITRDGKTISLGLHATIEDACRAYERAAIDLHGEYARTK